MKAKIKLIFTNCFQDGTEHFSQAYKIVETEIEVPTELYGRKIREWSFVGAELDIPIKTES
jgi:hypothetical protein